MEASNGIKSVLYIYKRTTINRLKKALKRPATYIYVAFVVLYLIFIIGSMGDLVKEFKIDTAESFATLVSCLVFYLIPGNMISYLKRKGLLFKPSDVHMVFPSPIGPKAILLLAAVKSFLMTFIIGVIFGIAGAMLFNLTIPGAILFTITFSIFENLLEGSIIVLCYGNETLSNAGKKVMLGIGYGIMLAFAVIAAAYMYKNGVHFKTLTQYINLPVVQLLPVIGWFISIIEFVVVGPTTINTIGSICYIVVVILFGIMAIKMKCTGEYYEDAIHFAEDYSLKRARAKKGEMTFGKGKKFKAASVKYKGKGAKAIFYRQLLEYKKTRFFIFGFQTIVSAVIGIGMVIFAVISGRPNEDVRSFIIPGIMAYELFIFSGYATKWAKELENPYTFLIPDSSFKKMWYATQMEIIRAFIDGMIMAIPGGIAFGVKPVEIVLSVLFFVCVSANRLYFNMLAEVTIGRILGDAAKSVLKVLLQGIVLAVAITAAVLVGMFINVQLAFFVLILVTATLTLGGMFGAATMFTKMEQV